MTLDILHFIDNKGGNAEEIRESQRKRGHPVEIVDEIIQMYTDWVKMDYDTNTLRKKVNEVQKEISTKKKAKQPADDLVATKKEIDAQVEAKKKEAKEFESRMRIKAGTVGNIVGKNVPVSLTEDDNTLLRIYDPKGVTDEPAEQPGILPHHEVLLKLDAMDLERGAKVVGHRGYYLINDGVDLNQALISYGLDFLRKKGYKKIQPPFMMNKDQMGKTAQLEQFDEELYKVIASDDEKYLIATSEQPISAFHSDEWFESPDTQLPLKYAGYSTCFRKEAGSAGRDMWGIFRVHQFEKVEQFVITDPEKSWETFDQMIAASEEFYQSLGLRYRVVGIVSGALNLAASQKHDLEAYFPFQKAYKELVSCSNCTDYQSRRLEIRCGLKSKDQTRKVYVHMLNGTLVATERTLCCLVENYQTPEGLVIPEVLRPYMQGREFIPFVKELPKGLQRKQGIMNNGGLLSPVTEKRHKVAWASYIFLPIPGSGRRLRILVPNASAVRYHLGFSARSPRMRRKRPPLLVFVAGFVFFLFFLFLTRRRRYSISHQAWTPEPGEDQSSTLVFHRKDLQRIWTWEISSGHYPSSRTIPEEIALTELLTNPSLPLIHNSSLTPRYRSSTKPGVVVGTRGVGPKRVYLDIQSKPPEIAFPPRPIAGSVADMDIIMKHCDFSQDKYVRDCLEVLRIGGGLDNGERTRRGKMDDWHYIYIEQLDDDPTDKNALPESFKSDTLDDSEITTTNGNNALRSNDSDTGLRKKAGTEWEKEVRLPDTTPYTPYYTLDTPSRCNPDNPRLFHMFWAGPFTDKPYLALLSFLYTQNTGIHLHEWPEDAKVCRPQFWLWINPGPAASVPNPNAVRDMYQQLKSNPWASPFLHPRFKDIIHFKLWNTTEQLDGVPEIKDEWRKYRNVLFNSGGHVVSVKAEEQTSESANSTSTATSSVPVQDDSQDMTKRLGSKSSDTYDRMSVILSDMARFVLCHRFGGIYLDADTIFLRDWEELWGWRGAFAYRWSRLPNYNTAVLRMNKGSALGTFLFRTALKNGLDFHPMTVSRYTADAAVEGLLLRLPDALFDSAWLNTEDYQRDRPPQPYFTLFEHFFETPARDGAAPQALGFRGFFRGAYSYHFHNFWWKPFDPARNFPDLGSKFKAGEDAARAALRKEKNMKKLAEFKKAAAEKDAKAQKPPPADPVEEEDEDRVEKDKRDLDWAAVLKRTFEAYIRGERPNMYGEWITWD